MGENRVLRVRAAKQPSAAKAFRVDGTLRHGLSRALTKKARVAARLGTLEFARKGKSSLQRLKPDSFDVLYVGAASPDLLKRTARSGEQAGRKQS